MVFAAVTAVAMISIALVVAKTMNMVKAAVTAVSTVIPPKPEFDTFRNKILSKNHTNLLFNTVPRPIQYLVEVVETFQPPQSQRSRETI